MSQVDDMGISEKECVEELRKKMTDAIDKEMSEDISLFTRFLKAKDFNITEAEDMLRKHLEWRKNYQIDRILKDYKRPEVLQKYLGDDLFGYDKEGSAVLYSPLGNMDHKGLLMSTKFVDLMKTLVQIIEETVCLLKTQSKKMGKKVYGFSLICDLENLSFAQATDKKSIDTLIQLLKMYQENYPEQLKSVYLIRAPFYFTIPFSILKSFITGTILEKIQVLGEDWKEELLKVIDAEQLPAFLGGTMTDPDGNPLCKTIINHGGIVPESYYIHKSKRSLAHAPDVKKIVLARASFSELPVEVNEPDSLIEWEFETKTRDIGFGLFFHEMVDGEEINTELVPLQRIDTEEYSETGVYKCKNAGTYIILFDNTYSWVRSKEIYYKIKVVNAKEHEAQMSQLQ